MLYSFRGVNGRHPQANVVFGPNGALGSQGGNGGGVVFELAPPATAGGTWKESTIVKFGSASTHYTDGTSPFAGLVADGGNICGTNYYHGDEFACVDFG